MKVTIKWLKEYLDISLTPAELANRLTMAGLEVKGVQATGGTWDNIVVGQIKVINRHPNADRLSLVIVDLGTGQETVVCGATNLVLGDKIAFARVGAQLIDGHTGQVVQLKSAKIRGIVSRGMVCSEKELGISDEHEGIMVLPSDAPVGIPLTDYLSDVIFNLEVTPNRPDCLSVIGIAREAAALTGQKVHIPEINYNESALSIDKKVAVEIVAPELCPRYCASLITGVKVTESPPWMQHRLMACGMRPINNIVDITNYVMLEYGQPLHAFDYERIRGKKIIVRRPKEGESIITLDGVERKLSEKMLVIADMERAVAVAGVMGGANSEVTEGTTSILLEAASFNPTSIHHTGRTLNLPSEACMRFERGIRPELTVPALKRATQLIVQLGGGEAARGIVDVYPGKREPEPVLLSTSEVKRLLGLELNLSEIIAVLTSLGFDYKTSDSDKVLVTAPYWRSDIRLSVDLVEEVARITGYDRIPTTMLSQSIPRQNPAPMTALKRKIRQCLTGYGFQELVTYSMTGLEMLKKLSPEARPIELPLLRIANPMTAEQEYLHPNLRANLLSALALNRRYEEGGIRLFEVGRVYLPRPKGLPDEHEVLCGLFSGIRSEKSWLDNNQLVDFFDAKGIVEGLLSQLGVEASFESSLDESLHSARQAAVVAGGKRLGVFGEVHMKVMGSFEIAEPAYLFEIDLPGLLPFVTGHKMFKPIPRFPSVVRDIALVLDTGIIHQRVLDIIKGFPLVGQVNLFDVYSGEQVPAGKKSLAYRITYQSPTHTLTDDEVNKVQHEILDRLSQEFGATLRS
jgi:phenylalanyl-tRNA synthetase beta chain